MAQEHELHCDDGQFLDWTSHYMDDPSVIEQVAAAAHNGARGNRIVINEDMKVAYASLENWASAMSMGELRAIGHWWKVVNPAEFNPPGTMVIAVSINAVQVILLGLSSDNEVNLTIKYDGGLHRTAWYPLFDGTEWHHVRLVVIRHATAGGAQLYDGNNLLIDDTEYPTADKYNGTPDWLHAGGIMGPAAGFEICQDEFRIATTRIEAKPKLPIPPGLLDHPVIV